MPKIVAPGHHKQRPYPTRAPKTLRVNSTRALRLRALAVAQAAEKGIMSWADAEKATKIYQRVAEMMLNEHELKQAGIRDEVPEDNAPEEPIELELGTHQKRKAVIKRKQDALNQPTEERIVSVELSGVDQDALRAASLEHVRLEEAELEDAMRPLDDND